MAKKRIMEKFEAHWNRRSSSSQEQREEEEEPSNGVGDLFSGPGFNNIHRGSRMARARRTSLDSLKFPKPHVPPPPPPPVIDITKLNYLFKKQLKNSDVSTLRRIVIPKKEAEAYLPFLSAKEGITINMLDMDGVHEWCFKFRFWPNNSSRMYVLECTGDFANTHGLKPGDYIILYQTTGREKYIIEAKKVDQIHR
ncbi:B3 domain-containing transcription factor FUS3-like [Olea europaea var. sylvestris]|uniref:B3 domain-containing transcription factor FUS3-like n=1 Tax=Olea europaea var. sylvestris TaxID=158386 RepID=UPI000C1D6AF1|nr:B3 domain-containing transcription factor FUS3-like [Olea europaea var. sylvestris]